MRQIAQTAIYFPLLVRSQLNKFNAANGLACYHLVPRISILPDPMGIRAGNSSSLRS